MKTNRRRFITLTGIAAAGLSAGKIVMAGQKSKLKPTAGKLKLLFEPYSLALKHVFTIAGSSRTSTPVMLTKIEFDGVTGYGEASMPPYLGESQETATIFLSKVDLGNFTDPFHIEDILDYVDSVDTGNRAAKASVDIALHDLVGKLMGQSWYRIWGLNPGLTPNTSFTIGIDTPEVVRQKVAEASGFKILKVKLGRENDREMIQTIRSATKVPLAVDVNQGWKEKEKALEMIYWLKDMGIVMVEQPLPKEQIDDMAWLTARSPLPIFGDESVQRLPDVVKAVGVYHGINIKLMKCTGMREAFAMAKTAKSLGMKIMIGCMTETSCAVSAAAQLSPLAEFADLDGNLLISNDLYSGMQIIEGKITLGDLPGIGIRKI
ncbi:MAG: dipeptide epimerase [Bacteroidales bacterium]|jgi:L-alanine-DL-glutamate epimerase-like enolase superfamily enzyme